MSVEPTDATELDPVRLTDTELRELTAACVDALPVGVFILDDQLVFLYANDEMARINGRPVDQHVGHSLLEVLPQIAPVSLAALHETMRTGEPVDDLLVDRVLPVRRSYSLSYRRTTLPNGRLVVFGSIADVSQRARAAEVARDLGQRLGKLRDANVIGVMAGEETKILDANDYVLTMLGRTRAEIEAGSLDWSVLTPPEFAESDARIVEQMREHGDCPAYVKEFFHADGHRVPVVLAGIAFNADPLRWVVLLLDTSAMRRSERRAATLIQLATELAGVTEIDDLVKIAPLLADPLSGLTATIVTGDQLDDAEPDDAEPDDAERGYVIPVADGSDRPAATIRLTTASGDLDVHERSFAAAVEAMMSAAATQISLREARRLAELAGALDVMLDMVALDTAMRDEHGTVVDFRIQWVNQATSDAYGRSPNHMIGSTMLTLYPELRGSSFFEAHRAVVDTGVPFEDPEFVFVPSSPAVPRRVYELRVSKFGDGFISCSRDVTERSEAQRAVLRSRQQLEAAQRLARMGSWEWNLDTDERTWSRELYRLLAIDPAVDDAERQRLSRERIHPDDLHLSDAALAAATAGGGSFRYEQRLLLPGGQRLAVVTGEVVQDERGRIFRGTLRDVTDWRKAQDDSKQGRLALEAMQRACLPATLPTGDGWELGANYRPAHEEDRLGGDWYDAFRLPEGRLGLVVGDVTGHGLDAAAAMSQLRNAVRAFASAGDSPAAVLDAVARFHLHSDIDTFATCLYVVLDPADGALRWARAGHPPPIVVHGRDAAARDWAALEDGGGRPLGVPGQPYENREARLPDGGMLVLYTDGLVEERGVPIDVGIGVLGDFVSDRLDVPVAELVQDAVDELGARRSYIDDVCLLVARRTG